MSAPVDLVKAVRSGKLADVVAALDAGAPVELDDGLGVPGLPLGIACFMGHTDIVRELLRRGATLNLADNGEPVSPLAMAVRGGRTEVVRLLIECGAIVPPGMPTGLSEHELAAARWVATHPGEKFGDAAPIVEEIVMPRAVGTDTVVLEADIRRAVLEMEAQKEAQKKAAK